MPHIALKMLKGRTQEQKELVTKNLARVVSETLGCDEGHVSVSIEDYTALEWVDIFDQEITQKEDKVYKKPEYDPKAML